MSEWYGNCPKCLPEKTSRLYFKQGPNKAGKYTFTCYECGANTTREAIPAQFQSEYVDRLIDCGERMYEMVVAALCGSEWAYGLVENKEPLSGWRALVALREQSDVGS